MGRQNRRFVLNPDNKDALSAVNKIVAGDRQGDIIVHMSAKEMKALNSKDVYELPPLPEIKVRG